MNGRGQEVGIDLDPSQDSGSSLTDGVHPPPGGTFVSSLPNSRSHSRSQSWSFNSRGQRPGASDLTTSLAALNPITSVIREIVPSFGEGSDSSSGNSPTLMSRAASQVSLPLSGGIHFGEGLVQSPPSTQHPPHPHRTGGPRGAEGGAGERSTGNGNEDQNIGFEISDGIRWLEHNAIFIILLLLKFAWYHRSGRLHCPFSPSPPLPLSPSPPLPLSPSPLLPSPLPSPSSPLPCPCLLFVFVCVSVYVLHLLLVPTTSNSLCFTSCMLRGNWISYHTKVQEIGKGGLGSGWVWWVCLWVCLNTICSVNQQHFIDMYV